MRSNQTTKMLCLFQLLISPGQEVLHLLFDHIRSHCSDEAFTEICRDLRTRGCNLVAQVMEKGKGNNYNVSINQNKVFKITYFIFSVLQRINFSPKVSSVLKVSSKKIQKRKEKRFNANLKKNFKINCTLAGI